VLKSSSSYFLVVPLAVKVSNKFHSLLHRYFQNLALRFLSQVKPEAAVQWEEDAACGHLSSVIYEIAKDPNTAKRQSTFVFIPKYLCVAQHKSFVGSFVTTKDT
jgi:hypothetical protein